MGRKKKKISNGVTLFASFIDSSLIISRLLFCFFVCFYLRSSEPKHVYLNKPKPIIQISILFQTIFELEKHNFSLFQRDHIYTIKLNPHLVIFSLLDYIKLLAQKFLLLKSGLICSNHLDL